MVEARLISAHGPDGTVSVELTQGKVVILDAQDWALVSDVKWRAHRGRTTWYARSRRNGRQVWMHRLILAAPKGFDVDHIDGNGLNNRRENLRLASVSENRRNVHVAVAKSGFKGVSPGRSGRKWRAQIQVDKKKIHLGTFSTKEEACAAYDRAALKYFGEFARTNASMMSKG